MAVYMQKLKHTTFPLQVSSAAISSNVKRLFATNMFPI